MSDRTANLRRELERQGVRRREGQAIADQALDAIAVLLPEALAAGITKVEIQRLSGISRPTIDALLTRRG